MAKAGHWEIRHERDVLVDIEPRFTSGTTYPFQDSLRFSQVQGDTFYFLKGYRFRTYSAEGKGEETLTCEEIDRLITKRLRFELEGLDNT